MGTKLCRLFLATLAFLLVSPGLCQAGEPSWKSLLQLDDLSEAARQKPAAQYYRLTVERSFDPVVVIELSCGDDGTLRIRRIDRKVDEQKGTVTYTRLTEDSTIKASPQEIAAFRTLIDGSEFWKAPAADWREPGLDGSTWTLEGIRDGQYHRVTRINPFVAAKFATTAPGWEKLGPERSYAEGLLSAAFAYLWALGGSPGELY
ncbi:hypothetical protein DB345_02475 [Spartobacteria bacterium LR76]|nr:hypothetical protein DB345_02475 [Spartobacteria bacterium LR76]